MCVAIPGQVEVILERSEFSVPAVVRFPTGTHHIDLVFVPETDVGDWVIVHSGYAVSLFSQPPPQPQPPAHPQADERW